MARPAPTHSATDWATRHSLAKRNIRPPPSNIRSLFATESLRRVATGEARPRAQPVERFARRNSSSLSSIGPPSARRTQRLNPPASLTLHQAILQSSPRTPAFGSGVTTVPRPRYLASLLQSTHSSRANHRAFARVEQLQAANLKLEVVKICSWMASIVLPKQSSLEQGTKRRRHRPPSARQR